jgi:dienelactone hydrolase
VGPADEEWAKRVESWGYIDVLMDDFTSWGYGNICTNATAVNPKMRIHDVEGAIKYLKDLPEVDSHRIGLLGFSHGGWTIMSAIQSYAHLQDFHVKSAVAYYPFCDKKGLDKAVIPTLILMGDKDNWTPADQCRRVIAANKPGVIQAIFYPDTYHGFDNKAFYKPAFSFGRANNEVVTRRLEYNPGAASDAIKRTQAFFAQTLR